MDEQTKQTVRALLDLHPSGYAAEVAFTPTDTAAGLFRLLCLSILADDTVPKGAPVDATRALFERGWHSAPEMAKSGDDERAKLLDQAGIDDAGQASRRLGEATRFVADRYDGDLQRLRAEAAGDGGEIHRLLSEIPGMDDVGIAVFMRDAQMFWPEIAPFADEHALKAAKRLHLPSDPGELMEDVARGRGAEQVSWIIGALAMVDAADEYERVERAASGA